MGCIDCLLKAAFTPVLPFADTVGAKVGRDQPMSSQSVPGYLTEVEASHLLTQAIPGAIVLHLKREMKREAGRAPKRMFIELSLSEAMQHWRHIGELIRKAGAMEQQPPHADTAGTL